jgi:amidase
MSTECINAIYGRTVNGFNRNLSCGGSSGGEGALVGLRGSLLGFGSDIGGSIRVPSSFNGLYGLRGSYNRMPCAFFLSSCQLCHD